VKHQGMPDVKEKMKYIFPAIAIGVSERQLLLIMKKLNDCRYSLQLRIKLLWSQHMESLDRICMRSRQRLGLQLGIFSHFLDLQVANKEIQGTSLR
jgi:hypothetical protein